MAQLRFCAALAGALLLSGCGASDREPQPVNETAFGEMAGTIDKARGVQDTVDGHKQGIDEALQSQEGDASEDR